MNALNICYVSSELYPYAKTGGLADVSSSLPLAIKEKGHDIRLMVPKYKAISERKYTIREVIRLKSIPVKNEFIEYEFSAKTAFLLDSKVHVYFLENDELFNRTGLYVDPKSGLDYSDNLLRFSFFARSILETLKALHWTPDVIHCNDWQTALIPILLKFDPLYEEIFAKTKTILTIHNLAYQGIFSMKDKEVLSLPDELFEKDGLLEWYGKINLLKGAILAADFLTTVSPTYAKEISENHEYGYGLETILSNRKKELKGILNGVDYSIWNPEVDSRIAVRYNKDLLHLKKDNKKMLCRYCDFEFIPDEPIIGMVTRMDNQKGFDILEKIFKVLMEKNLKFVLLSSGDNKIEARFIKLSKKYKKKFFFENRLNDQLAHLIESGADIFLMPSKFEPCGLNQIYSLKYGTLPLVRKTGGLADTVIDVDEFPKSGTGFVFKEYSDKELLKKLEKVLDVFENDKTTWKKWQVNAMEQDYSWDASAQEYLSLYQNLSS